MLPIEYEKRMRALLCDEFDDYIKALDMPPCRAVRINERKCKKEDLLSSLPFTTEKIPYCDNGYYINAAEDDKLGALPYHHAGAFYVQEPAAMAPVCALDIKEDMLVLDVCASPGGKSTQAVSAIKSGVIVSNEIVKSRAVSLMGNIERMGIDNAIVTNTDSKTLKEWFCGVFDVVICDAPCSGEGMFRKTPAAISEWSYDNVKMCAERQTEILQNAAATVCGGGKLLYATCTFSKEENEDVVSNFLYNNPDFHLIQPSEALLKCSSPGIGMPSARRFYPHKSRGEGQFFALFEKGGEKLPYINYKDAACALSREEAKITEEFLKDTFDEIPNRRIGKIGKTICFLPDMPIPQNGVFSAGVKIGEIEKGRMTPHHHLFSAFGKKMKRKLFLSADGDDIKKYISGNVIDTVTENGWTAVFCGESPIGGGKSVNGTLKNFYPKGLRKNI